MPFDKILCAVDFSQCSENALGVAIALARCTGGRVTVLHVVETPDALIERAEYVDWLAQRYTTQLQEFMARLRQPEVNAEPVLLEGGAAARITEHAAKAGCDVVVVGTRGKGGFARLVLGSVAERVVRTSTVPVLTVPLSGSDGGVRGQEEGQEDGDAS